jgi:hypothetical protein
MFSVHDQPKLSVLRFHMFLSSTYVLVARYNSLEQTVGTLTVLVVMTYERFLCRIKSNPATPHGGARGGDTAPTYSRPLH